MELDYAWFDAQTNRYTLGLKMFEVGSASLHRLDIVAAIRNCMTEIYRQINETMHLGVRAEKDILYIDKIESTRSIRMISYMGSRAPLYCTALGKAILADLPDAQVHVLPRSEALMALARAVDAGDAAYRTLYKALRSGIYRTLGQLAQAAGLAFTLIHYREHALDADTPRRACS